MTDRYPRETRWELGQDADNRIIGSLDRTLAIGTSYRWNMCLDPNTCYTFIITDSYGDGVCCGYGTGEYTLYYDDELIHSGGEFRREEVTHFGSTTCASAHPTATPHPSASTEPTRPWMQVGDDIHGEALGDQSGRSVALSSDGQVVAVGARYNDGGGEDSGQVRVYANTKGAWQQIGNDLDGAAGNQLGWSVSLSSDGSVLAVNSGRYPYHVNVFRWDGRSWQDLGPGIYGVPFALSDDGRVLALRGGYPGYDVKVFVLSGTDWIQRGGILSGLSEDDNFGFSIALSADGSIVACTGNPPAGSGNPTYVRLSRWNGATWLSHGATLFGASGPVSLSGDGRILTTRVDNDVAVYQYGGHGWARIGQTIESWLCGYPAVLSLDGNTIVCRDYIGGSIYVAVYRLSPNRDQWLRVGQGILAANGNDFSSLSVSGDGSRIAVGEAAGDANGIDSGTVRVFDPII